MTLLYLPHYINIPKYNQFLQEIQKQQQQIEDKFIYENPNAVGDSNVLNYFFRQCIGLIKQKN